jgi:catechol 2,3-dioxygenase-like lactoylglutathione lyase family enzyme
MPTLSVNHVSLHAYDLDESTRFYVELFGMAPIPTPSFGFPVQWLRLGAQQLHLFVRDNARASAYHHLGLNVEDFHAVYRKVRDRQLADGQAFFSTLYVLPDGAVQMYLRDPAENLVEVNWPDVTTLDRRVVGEVTRLADVVPQTAESLRATLYHDGRP